MDLRQVGVVTLEEALFFLALVALKDRPRSRRMAARWLQRWLAETAAPTIEDAPMIAGALAALGGPRHEHALTNLQAATAS
jgi:hypothetical protein